MHGTGRIDKKNYHTLIIAGLGTIGKSLITLGVEQFSLFERIIAIDKNSNCLKGLMNSGVDRLAGDISDQGFLKTLLASIPEPALFINLCSGTNNVRIRANLAPYDAAYLDSCSSATADPAEYRFSRFMPYTYTNIDTTRPHWLCWGINPGLVEIIVRRILANMPTGTRTYDVAIYEFDRLANKAGYNITHVGWCPEALVEEIMLSPTMEIVNGLPKEDAGRGTRCCKVMWENQPVPARIVGHEDIWNLSEIPAVKNGRFYYSLSPAVMDILNLDDAQKARSRLTIPDNNDAITGLEQVAVQVSHEKLGESQTLVWTEDHSATWEKHGVNAVQYQTAKSLLLAIMLLQCTDYGLVPMAHNASNLPITPHDWPIIDRFMQELEINWQDGAYLDLQIAQDN